MKKMLLVITESKGDSEQPYYLQQLEDSDKTVDSINRCFNIDPSLFSENLEVDMEQDSVGPMSTKVVPGAMVTTVKVYEEAKMVFPAEDFPEYLKHREYNAAHGISYDVTYADCDDQWMPL